MSKTTTLDILQPEQPLSGPGGSAYSYDSYASLGEYKDSKDWILYYPTGPKPKKARLLIFVHGYAQANPAAYGGWIRHHVRKGHVVILPRYQNTLWTPYPSQYTKHSTIAIKKALERLKLNTLGIEVDTSQALYYGHSFGAVIAANLSAQYEQLELPKPIGLLLAQPGHGIFLSSRLESYHTIPKETPTLIITGEHDGVVAPEIAEEMYSTMSHLQNKQHLIHFADSHGKQKLKADHGAPCYYLNEFDLKLYNPMYLLARMLTEPNAENYFCYWKFGDALSDLAYDSSSGEYAFGGSEKQLSMGYWSDGKAVKPMQILG